MYKQSLKLFKAYCVSVSKCRTLPVYPVDTVTRRATLILPRMWLGQYEYCPATLAPWHICYFCILCLVFGHEMLYIQLSVLNSLKHFKPNLLHGYAECPKNVRAGFLIHTLELKLWHSPYVCMWKPCICNVSRPRAT